MTSHLKGPSEGEWSVFASKVVEERDTLLAEVERLRADRAADLKTMDEMATDAREYAEKRDRERDALLSDRDAQKAQAERAEASALDWQQRFESDMDGDIAEQLAERDGLESERDHYRVAAAKERDRAERAEAEAAAMRSALEKVDALTLGDLGEVGMPKVQAAVDAAHAALSADAARALLSAPATPLADDYSTDALLSAPAQSAEDVDTLEGALEHSKRVNAPAKASEGEGK